jgi:hypothetical protein
MDISADRIGATFVDLDVTTYIEKSQGDTAKNTSFLLKVYSRESGLLEAQKEIKLGVLKKGDTKSVRSSPFQKPEDTISVVSFLKKMCRKAMEKFEVKDKNTTQAREIQKSEFGKVVETGMIPEEENLRLKNQAHQGSAYLYLQSCPVRQQLSGGDLYE